MPDTDRQLALPFPLDKVALTDFLTRFITIEEEQDRLREVARVLKEDYKDTLPLRGVLTAVKICRATRKLETHPNESMKRGHLVYLEALVEEHLDGRQAALDALMQDAEGARITVHMMTGEVTS